jgi:transposase
VRRKKGLIAGPCKSLARGNRIGAMTPEALFTAALQLEAGWKVTECRFAGEPCQLLLKLDFEQGKRFGCPPCGKPCPIYDTSIKRWRHLNF